MRALIQEANRRVFRRSSEDAAVSGMGTTMTVALVDADAGRVLGHVGDSRAYRVRQGDLEQLTDDHSLVGELTERQALPRGGGDAPAALGDHARGRHRAGRRRRRRDDPPEPGDVFLLCSDGLTDMVADREILALVDGSSGLDDAARRSWRRPTAAAARTTSPSCSSGRVGAPRRPCSTTRTRSRASTRSRWSAACGRGALRPRSRSRPDTGRGLLLLLAVLVLAIATLAIWGLTR